MPYVQFVESAGADLRGGTGEDPDAATRRAVGHFAESGRLFYEISELSKMRIPTVSVVFGASTAGGAYQPGMSDYNIFIKNQSRVFLGGPPLVKMATGEDADAESLGGAEMHARISGLGDYLAEDELDGIRILREVMSGSMSLVIYYTRMGNVSCHATIILNLSSPPIFRLTLPMRR